MDDDKLNAVRRAKKRFAEIAPKDIDIAGIGIALTDGDPALKVNLRQPAANPDALPKTVDGVAVIYEVVGKIMPR